MADGSAGRASASRVRVLAALFLACLLLPLWLGGACAGNHGLDVGETLPTGTGSEGSSPTVSLVRVVDGDTIVVRTPEGREERLRYIGIDAPESVKPDAPVEPLGPEAALHNEHLLHSGPLRLVFDVEERDQYGRLLAYVWAGEVFVNERMVRDGFARAKRYPPNLRFQERLFEAERAARAAGVGLWAVDAIDSM